MADSIDYTIHYLKWHKDSEDYYESMVDYYIDQYGRYLPQDKSIKILDIGCGTGLLVYALNKAGYMNVKGIDVSPHQISAAKKYGLNVECVDSTVDWLRNYELEFDVVFLLDVLEHIHPSEHLKLLRTIHDKLSVNGMLILTVPNANSTFASRWRYIDWTHYTSFTEHSLEFVLINSGFKKIKIMEIEFFKRPRLPFIIRKSVIHWLLLKLVRMFRRIEAYAELGREGLTIPLSLNLLCIAKKQEIR
ncbi:MAG: class I SAM-dependent methyltransferase [bacterium]